MRGDLFMTTKGKDVRRNGWHITQDDTSYTLSRQWPPRFDVQAQARFPVMRKSRLARHIRQDLWRALKGLRGFAPVIQIHSSESQLHVTAGGQVQGAVPHGLSEQIQSVLDCPKRRARWEKWAGDQQ
jgi:hypothetical protein